MEWMMKSVGKDVQAFSFKKKCPCIMEVALLC
jgi:hypothetical protein